MSAILAVDDDPAILRTLRITLTARGYQVSIAADGRTALAVLAERREDRPFDLVLLDLGLPDLDGVTVLERLRETSPVPVIVLTARHGSDDKVEALDLGADDYVTKPFGMEELLARIRAALRRGASETEPTLPVITTESLVLDLAEHRATKDGVAVHLTPTEWALVTALTTRPGRLVRQSELLQEVWGPSYHRETNYLRVYLGQLRRKLETNPAEPRHFRTEPGVGYRFVL